MANFGAVKTVQEPRPATFGGPKDGIAGGLTCSSLIEKLSLWIYIFLGVIL